MAIIKKVFKLFNNKSKNEKSISENIPSYMIINHDEKEKLIYSISLVKSTFVEANNTIKEKEEEKLKKTIEDKCNVKISELLDEKYIESIVKKSDIEDRKSIISNYRDISNKKQSIDNHIIKIDEIIKVIDKNKISILMENDIEKEIDNVTNDKNVVDNIDTKINDFIKKVLLIIKNNDQNILEEVTKKYKKINFITLSTIIVDKNYKELNRLKEEFKKHHFNKFYYEREIKIILKEIGKIKRVKNNQDVIKEINGLQKELYIKSKDKYDLLYNNEIFAYIEKECNSLLEKVNAKVVDIKKDKSDDKHSDNIVLRFQDIELASNIIDCYYEENYKKYNKLEDFIKTVYSRYNQGIKEEFNFEKNKIKTEYVVLFNDLNKIISEEKKEQYILIEHINFRMSDLKEAVRVKLNEVLNIAKNKNIDCNYIKNSKKIKLLMKNKKY